MTRYNSTSLAAFAATLLFAAAAQAGTIKSVVVANGGAGALAGTTTNDILIDAGPTEQIGAIQIYAELSEGSFYNDGFGGNTPPNPAFFVPFPAVQFDTFVASGQPINTNFNPVMASASVNLGSPNSGGPSPIFDSNTVDVTFGPQAGQNTLGALDFLAARLTIGSEGIFRMDVEFSGSGPHATIMNGTIVDGQVRLDGPIIPEPASITLFGLALLGMVGLVRRHR
jgi:hypothetical protein